MSRSEQTEEEVLIDAIKVAPYVVLIFDERVDPIKYGVITGRVCDVLEVKSLVGSADIVYITLPNDGRTQRSQLASSVLQEGFQGHCVIKNLTNNGGTFLLYKRKI